MRIGFIVNPIAGMGGRVGLKGTDGRKILDEALSRGAESWSPLRARETLEHLKGIVDRIQWVTWGGEMGEDVLTSVGFEVEVVGRPVDGSTTADDTCEAVLEMERKGVDIIVFVGGDGTAADIIEAVDRRVPIFGIPSGVKMFSGVFAPTPAAASSLIRRFIDGEVQLVEREVMDIDEDEYRAGRLSASLKGYAVTPYEVSLVQNSKTVGGQADEELMKEAVAARIVDDMRPGVTYVLGPGSTVSRVAETLGVEKTILGIDVVRDGRLVASDVDERTLVSEINGESWVILSPLGGQGTLLGRGNQPISPEVIRRIGLDHIIVIATPVKLYALKALTVDTGDPELDEQLRGYKRVVVGYHEEKVIKVL